jgi:hypothetical protein
MNINVVSSRAMNVIFKKIDFALQKGIGAQFVARLSFIYM